MKYFVALFLMLSLSGCKVHDPDLKWNPGVTAIEMRKMAEACGWSVSPNMVYRRISDNALIFQCGPSVVNVVLLDEEMTAGVEQ